MADFRLAASQAEAQKQAQLQAARETAKMAERQRIAGFTPSKTVAPSAVGVTSAEQEIALSANNIKLSDGTWVTKEEFYKLSEDDQSRLMSLGVQGFNNYYARKDREFRANNVQLKDGSWVDKSFYNKLSDEDRSKLYSMGVDTFNEYQQEQFNIFKQNNVQLDDGSWIGKADYDNLNYVWQAQIKRLGVNGFNSWLNTAYGGASELIQVTKPDGRVEIYGKTEDPNIGLDASGNRFYIGGRWPDSVSTALTKGEPLSSRWLTEVSTFQPVTPATTVGVTTSYSGLASALGGAWGNTPEVLAAQGLGAGLIEYAKPEGKVSVSEKQLIEEAISKLSPAERERYEKEAKAILAEPGTTLTEKLSSRYRLSSDIQRAIEEIKSYKALGVDLVMALSDKGENIVAVQFKNGQLLAKDIFDNLNMEKQKLITKGGLEAVYHIVKKTGELVDKDSLAELKKSDVVLASALADDGYTAYQSKLDELYVKLQSTGEYLSKQSYNEMPVEAQEFVQNKGLEALRDLQNGVLSKLNSYKSKDGYNVVSYLRDNGNKSEVAEQLVISGFKKTDIDGLLEFNKQPFAEENKAETVWRRIQNETAGEFEIFSHLVYPITDGGKDRKLLIEKYPKLAAEFFRATNEMESGFSKDVQPPLSLESFAAEYGAARGVEGVGMLFHSELDKANMRDLASFKYEQLYGTGQAQKAVGAAVIATLWTPGKVAYPEVSAKDIKAMEWAIGAAQIALLAAPGAGAIAGRVVSPLAGRLMSIGIQSASGIVFAAETAKSANETMKNWDTMTTEERNDAKKNLAFSALMDAWVIAGVAGELKGIRTASATKPKVDVKIPKQTAIKPTLKVKEFATVKDMGILASEAPKIPEGYTRLYRGEPKAGVGYYSGKDISKLSPKSKAGRWYTPQMPEAQMYTSGAKESVLYFVDVPTKELPKLKPSGTPEQVFYLTGGQEHYILPNKYLTRAKLHPESLSLKSLQSKLDKFVTVSPEEAAILRANAPQQVDFGAITGKVTKGVNRLQAEKLLRLAKASGRAYDEMKANLIRLYRLETGKELLSYKDLTRMTTVKPTAGLRVAEFKASHLAESYTDIAAKTQKSIQKSLRTDKALFAKLETLSDITPKELDQLEQLSKLKGIKQGIKNINESIRAVGRAWNLVEKTKLNTPQRLQALKSLDEAKTNLNKVLEDWNARITKPRYRTGVSPSATEIVNKIENDISEYQRLLNNRHELYKKTYSTSERDILRDEIRELNSEIQGLNQKLKQYTDLMNRGEDLPAEVFKFEGKPKPIFEVGVAKPTPIEPLGGTPGVRTVTVEKVIKEKAIDPKTGKTIEVSKKVVEKKTQVATMEKTPLQQAFLFEEIKGVKEKPRLPETKAKVPEVKEEVSPIPESTEDQLAQLTKLRDSTKAELDKVKVDIEASKSKIELSKLLKEKQRLTIRLLNIDDKIVSLGKPVVEKQIQISRGKGREAKWEGKPLTATMTPAQAAKFYEMDESEILRDVIGIPIPDEPKTEFEFAVQSVVGAAIKARSDVIADFVRQPRIEAAGIVKAQPSLATALVVDTKLQARIESATRNAVETQLKTIANPRVRQLVKTKYQQKIIEKLKTPIKVPPPILIIKLPDSSGGGEVELTEKQWHGIVAWKQGKLKRKGGELKPFYWMKYPDKNGRYPDENTIHTTDPIEGVKYEEGIGSVAKSIIKKYGEIPKELQFSMGIQSVTISRDRQSGIQQPKIKFGLKRQYKKGRSLHPVKPKKQPELVMSR